MQGFIVTDYAARFGEGIKALAGWVKEDKISYEETVTEGFENIPPPSSVFSGAKTRASNW
jgi:NADPH-dependent curcumin reductase CurA